LSINNQSSQRSINHPNNQHPINQSSKNQEEKFMESTAIRRSFTKAGLLALMMILVQAGVFALWNFVFFPGTENVYVTQLLPLILSYIIIIPLAWLMTKRSVDPERMPPKHNISIGKIIAWFLAIFALSRIVTMITSLINNAIAGEEVVDAVTGMQMESPLMMFLLAVFVAPFAEEILFRGFLYKILAPYGGQYYVLISALLFSLFHMNFNQIPATFVLGLLLAYVMYRTGNILIPIVLHFINNLISSIGAFFLESPNGILVIAGVIMGFIVAGLVVGIVLLATKGVKRDVVFEPAAMPAKAGHAFVNGGVIPFILVSVAATIGTMMGAV
jgi:membrane protease YdiL (CAAX protease family)